MVNTIRPIVITLTYQRSKYLTSLLKTLLGNTDAHVKNSTELVETLDSLVRGPGGRLVSLDVVSLFTGVPLRETLDLLTPLFSEATVWMFVCLDIYVLHISRRVL